MRKIVFVLVGGFCGTITRVLLQAPLRSAALALLPHASHAFPYDLFVINVSGALALGLLYGLFEYGAALPPSMRLALGTGFLGAYTTFSSFVYGGMGLLEHGEVQTALVYLGGSMALGVFAARVGESLARVVVARRRMFARVRVSTRRLGRGVLAYAHVYADHPSDLPDPTDPAEPADPIYDAGSLRRGRHWRPSTSTRSGAAEAPCEESEVGTGTGGTP